MHRCLYCYKELKEGQADFHPACSRKMFGTTTPPTLPYTRENIAELAEQVIRSQSAVTGVQPKRSLDLQKVDKSTARLRSLVCGDAIFSSRRRSFSPAFPNWKT